MTFQTQQHSTFNNLVSLLQNGYARSVILKVLAEQNNIQSIENSPNLAGQFNGIKVQSYIHQAQFIICQSCFWCASYISPTKSGEQGRTTTKNNNATNNVIMKCPSCIEGDIEAIPIAENERYRFES